jgi:aquaporin Z
MNSSLFKKGIAECIGTFVLVFAACGVAAITNGNLVATAMAFGLVIVAMAYTIGRISGCHINPAVSIAFLIKKKLTVKEFLLYVCAQVLGGFVGALLIFGIFKMNTGSVAGLGDASNYTLTGELKAGPIFAAIIAEVVLTCIFVFVILHVTDEKSEKVSGKLAGLIIGFTLVLVHLIGIGLTGTSVNPARSLATAITSAIYFDSTEALKQVWIFILAPLAGGVLAAILHTLLTKGNDEETKDEQ